MRIPVLLSAVLFAAAAHAEWQSAGVPGRPNDVQVWRPGVYTVSTDLAAHLFQADGGTQQFPNASVGTYLAPGDCLVSLNENGRLVSAGTGCQPFSRTIFTDPSFEARRMRHDVSGPAFAFNRSLAGTTLPELAYSMTPADPTASWTILELPEAINYGDAMGVIRHGGFSHALLHDRTRNLLVHYNEEKGTTRVLAPEDPNLTPATSIDLFNGGGFAPTALFGTASGLYRMELGTTPSPPSFVALPTGREKVTGVDVNTGTGSAIADGFGMAVVPRSTGSVVLSAMPTDNLATVGATWQVNPTFRPIPGYETAQLRSVSCFGAEFCVIGVEQGGGQNLLIYRNAHAPAIDAPPELRLSERQLTSHFVPVSDADGDAVLAAATWFSSGPLSVSASASPGGVTLQFRTEPVCVDTPIGRKVDLFASDGLARHERTASFPVIVRHTVPPGTPTISPEVSVVAGTGARDLQASPGTGCPPKGYTWTALNGAPALGQDGSARASFPTPPVTCEPRRYTYQVQASDDAGTSNAGTFTVTVEPWGEPSAAFAQDAKRDVTAGQSARVTPDALHTCASSAGFPGVETVWRLGDGSTPAIPGVKVFTASGEEVSTAAVTSPHLTVTTDDCTDTTVPLTAYHRTRDTSGVRGPESQVRVEVKTRLDAVSQGTLDLVPSPDAEGPRIMGASRVRGLNCVERRPGLQARLRVLREDGSDVGQPRTVSVPGPWDVEVDGCGETFRVTGKLLDERGEEVGTAGEVAVTTRLVDAALGELAEGAALVARCGEGARGSLTQLIPPEACSAARISWEHVNGPALAATTLSGRTVDMATRETGLDHLVGQRVRVAVTADAGGGNVVRREHEVPITAEPFVEVTHEKEKPSGSESGLLGVSVSLRNSTACGVSEVVFEERLEGMAYVAGTARLDGQPVDVEQQGDVLRVRGLTLGGDAVRRFTYVARPTLLGTPRMEARAFMGPVPITRDTRPVPPEAGCGCSSGSSGATAFGLAALAMLRRRRRA